MEAFADVTAIGPQQLAPGVVSRAVHGEQLTLSLIEFAADASLAEHAHTNEQLGLLLDGSLTLRIGAESRELSPGAMWRIAAHTPHGASCGAAGAVVVEAFAPVRDDWALLAVDEPSPGRWP